MAHITAAYTSNFDESKESATLAQQGKPSHWPPLVHSSGEKGMEAPAELSGGGAADPVEAWGKPLVPVAEQKAAGVAPEDTVTIADQKAGVPPPLPPEGSDPSSAGTSSSTSESKPDKSGSSAPETESSLPSPAPTAESPSRQDPASKPAQSSTAPSTSGSTQETGPSQADPSNSSEEPATPEQSATEATPPPSGRELMQQARQAYEAKDWTEARDLLKAAADADASLNDEVNLALQAVQTASEADPSGGGFLVP